MKLLDRYNRVSLLATISMIVIAGIVYYFTISLILTNQVDKDLLVEENEIFDYVGLNHRLPQVFKSDDLKIRFTAIPDSTIVRRIADSHFYDDQEHEDEAARMLTSSVRVGAQLYRINITESKVETDDLIRMIFLITLGLIFVLLVVLLLINRTLMRKLWEPFYETLKQIKLFNVADRNGICQVDTRIDEFQDLNREVTAMSQRVLHDYQSLKSFTENASHELMTPLAVIISKLETLMQDNDITERQGALIGEAYQTVDRLKKLNRSMLLLSRIENKLMHDAEDIDLQDTVRKKIIEFQELLADKHIVIREELEPHHIKLNRDLLNIMLNNLLGNAIQHNRPGGRIVVQLTGQQLSFCNTGTAVSLNQQTIFQRFHKSPESEGTGLGLTLVKQICDNYGFALSYAFNDQLHCFTVVFVN
ncbi:signal transduction histidine kinase [Mucilaginibacter yixingensis]|uniref:histidine kinase n=1 Tax=Mucilaginibacter yixingensis TaxID=1295612 RepID=A0A2T5JGX7_9SPHI|nr:HAMP domain-containing sensor histidine kinase [Mucilaginibacter yixingensis]PTR01685.1 signal transduction histidine kinase [Mucilaginibacter yixingensis]